MERDAAIDLIVRATKWLFASRCTHSGSRSGNTYTVEISAETPDVEFMVRGVGFGTRVIHMMDGSILDYGSLLLIDYDDPASFWDYVPFILPIAEDPHVEVASQEGVAMDVLAQFHGAKLIRMANNARRILEEHGQQV